MHGTYTLLLSVQALSSRPNGLHSLKRAVMASYSSWRGSSASHLGWLLAQKQFSWMWKSRMKVGTGLVCVLVLLWPSPNVSEAHNCRSRNWEVLLAEGQYLSIPDNNGHHLPLPHTLSFPWPLNLSFKLLLQKIGAVMSDITFQKKSHHTFNVSNTIFSIAKFLEIAD